MPQSGHSHHFTNLTDNARSLPAQWNAKNDLTLLSVDPTTEAVCNDFDTAIAEQRVEREADSDSESGQAGANQQPTQDNDSKIPRATIRLIEYPEQIVTSTNALQLYFTNSPFYRTATCPLPLEHSSEPPAITIIVYTDTPLIYPSQVGYELPRPEALTVGAETKPYPSTSN